MKKLIFILLVGLYANIYCQDTSAYFDYSDKEITKGKIRFLPIIYYDDCSLCGDNKQVLDSLSAFLMINNDVQIDIAVHTDCRGSEQINLKLSSDRAALLKGYLTKLGVESSRIGSKGYGEKIPSVKCDCLYCTEEEHQKNRRTVVMIK